MGKGKKSKKKGAKHHPVTEDVLDATALTLKKFRRISRQVSKLSTPQKVFGGMALLAAGLTYLTQQRRLPTTSDATPAAAADTSTPARTGTPTARALPSSKLSSDQPRKGKVAAGKS